MMFKLHLFLRLSLGIFFFFFFCIFYLNDEELIQQVCPRNVEKMKFLALINRCDIIYRGAKI